MLLVNMGDCHQAGGKRSLPGDFLGTVKEEERCCRGC